MGRNDAGEMSDLSGLVAGMVTASVLLCAPRAVLPDLRMSTLVQILCSMKVLVWMHCLVVYVSRR